MNWDELYAMVESGLVEIGSHTCHHTRLNDATSDQDIEREVLESQRLLQERLGRSVRLFCYPNGDVSLKSLDWVQQYYDAAVTTSCGINTSATDIHQLMRISIHEDISYYQQIFFSRLSSWI